MAIVTYFISSGLPCSLPGGGIGGVTLREALADFKVYRDECERLGNVWRDAYMDVVFDIPSCEPSRTYEFGPRGGIRLVEE